MHQQQHPSTSSATAELQHLLLTPTGNLPPTQQHNPAAIAHAQLQSLRDSGDVHFLFLRCILELTTKSLPGNVKLLLQEEELLFHCVTGCRHVLLTKWNSTSSLFRRGVRDYLLACGIQSTVAGSVSRTIRLAYLNASASFWKRSWADDWQQQLVFQGQQGQTRNDAPPSALEQSVLEQMQQSWHHYTQRQPSHNQQPVVELKQFEFPGHLLEYMQQMLLRKDSPRLQLAATSFTTVLLGEFAGGTLSAHYNMPLEFHKRAHTVFELGLSPGTILEGPSRNGIAGATSTPPPPPPVAPLNQCLQMSLTALGQLVPTLQHDVNNNTVDEVALAIVQLTIDVIGWEWGTDAWDSGVQHTSVRALVRPPAQWRDALLQPEFVKAMFQVHHMKFQSAIGGGTTTVGSSSSQQPLLHGIRQLLLLLTSLTGPMFDSVDERKQFAHLLLEGILSTLQHISTNMTEDYMDLNDMKSSLILDAFSMTSRLFVNYKLSILVELSSQFNALLSTVASLGRQLLQDNLHELQSRAGDLELMEHREWREEALTLLVEGLVLLCGDPWLLYSGSEEFRRSAQAALARTLGPLYTDFIQCRTQMARLEEMYFTAHETELDEVREEIFAVDLEDEMTALAQLGRLDLHASLNCLASLFQQLIPQLQQLWDGNVDVVTPEAAGLLEESRLVTLYVGHLLTDDNEGETPVIPDTVLTACQASNGEAVTQAIQGAVQTLLHFAHFQATKIAQHPSDPRLSPLLAKSFLWFLYSWAPAYILPVDYGATSGSNTIVKAWTSPEVVQESVSFVITLCLHYHCYWPHEPQVQENATILLHALAKRCRTLRLAMVATPSFRELISFHCLTSGIRHSAPPSEFESTVRAKTENNAASLNFGMVRGYQRLPYAIKSKVLTALLVGCSEHEDVTSKNLLNECLVAIHEAFSSLVHALSSKQMSPDNVDAKEMASLCVELYGGVARAGEMVASERISKFLTPSLPHLSGLMAFYAKDLSICESLLRLFRDYAEQFIAVLDTESCVALFQASGELLKSYSSVHCSSARVVVHSSEEEQNYNDILCAIQLLIQLGTKDFIDVGAQDGIQSDQVTEMIFFGLQQILPLMTRGLLQYPTLCSQYFSLVGFMMETYPDKVRILPYDLFDALLESLLFGMSYHDTSVAKSSLQGLAGIVREQVNSRVLDVHLATNPDLLDKCSHRLLMEVIFQNCVWDRIETAGMGLLPLAAVDLKRFASVVQRICQQIPPGHQARLSGAFERLLQPEVLSKSMSSGYEGRQNRVKFKKDFENFCQEIHSFFVLK